MNSGVIISHAFKHYLSCFGLLNFALVCFCLLSLVLISVRLLCIAFSMFLLAVICFSMNLGAIMSDALSVAKRCSEVSGSRLETLLFMFLLAGSREGVSKVTPARASSGESSDYHFCRNCCSVSFCYLRPGVPSGRQGATEGLLMIRRGPPRVRRRRTASRTPPKIAS